ncbi:unnamed protein product [Brachionus calyciflorus]|uniref:Caveolin n=1 Tax=Brachionus calyciflorus TaxID=104777 RepID=A0A814KU54_9BILA|nr:unnamed protein product [Brachionus calyciflorus]
MPGKAEIDLINRDPNVMNNHVQVMFDDVLAEPEGAHSADCVWRNSHKCFTCGRNLCYKILTYICGLPLALFWGCVFAMVSFSEIWCVTPHIRCLHVTLYSVKKMLSIILGSILGPIMETYGMIFSRIHITQSQGEPPKPLGSLPGNPPRTGRHD